MSDFDASLMQEELRFVARNEEDPMRAPALEIGQKRQDEGWLTRRDGCDRPGIEVRHAGILAVIEEGDAIGAEVGEFKRLKPLLDEIGRRRVLLDRVDDILAQDAPFLAANLHGGAGHIDADSLVGEVCKRLTERL